MNTFLEKLPDINFAEKDTAVIEADVIAAFEATTGRRLFPGDPLRLLLLTFVKYLSLQRSIIDFSGKQNLIKYTSGEFLQNLSALVGTERLLPTAAGAKLKFTITTVLPNNITIIAGTRATPGGKIFFATDKDVEILAGETSAEVTATCTQIGEIGNGFLKGQVNQISDPFPFCNTVENIETTQGGSDIESEESLRERTWIRPESFSSAGPYGAYIYWAKTASQTIGDVSVVSPSPGVVEVIPLLRSGEIPEQSILDAVYKECNDGTRRPFTDYLIVRAPEKINYEIEFTYYISRSKSTNGLNIQSLVIEATSNFISWQKSALGRDLNPSELTRILMETGIKRVVVTKPEFTVLQYYQIAIAPPENVTMNYGGLEDD